MRYGLAGMSGLSLLAFVHRLRAEAPPPDPAVDYLLGVAPNFAAAIAILFVLLGIWADQKREASFATAHRAFALCASISGLGLTAWEFVQRASDRSIRTTWPPPWSASSCPG